MPCSTRARSAMPVAAPDLEELAGIASAASFTQADVDELLDPSKCGQLEKWGYGRQQIPKLG